jgi:SSS family solute:Na+ symporter
MLGLAITGLLAAFMAGVAANVTAFNTVVTYDLWQSYVVKDRDPAYYIRVGRIATFIGLLVSIATAFIAKGNTNIMNYVQALFSIFNAPLFATFIIAMFWKRATPLAGGLSLIAGMAAAETTLLLGSNHVINLGSKIASTWYEAIAAFVADAVVLVVVSLVTQPRDREDLRGLVWGLKREGQEGEMIIGDERWYRQPVVLGIIALVIAVALDIIFI